MKDSDLFIEYEPIFLLDHLTFGVRLRKFSADSYEYLLKSTKTHEKQINFRFATLAIFREEINCYEDIGALLLAIKDKIESNVPIIETLMTFNTEKAVLHKLTAQLNDSNVVDSFYLHELITKEYLPTRYHSHLRDIRRRIATILKTGFSSNSAGERHDAYIRIKHGPVCFSTNRIFRSSDGIERPDLPGALIRPKRLRQSKKCEIDKRFHNFPFLPLGLRTDWKQINNALLSIDVCTRLQQVLIIGILQKFHSAYLTQQSITQEQLLAKGLELDRLLEQLPMSQINK